MVPEVQPPGKVMGNKSTQDAGLCVGCSKTFKTEAERLGGLWLKTPGVTEDSVYLRMLILLMLNKPKSTFLPQLMTIARYLPDGSMDPLFGMLFELGRMNRVTVDKNVAAVPSPVVSKDPAAWENEIAETKNAWERIGSLFPSKHSRDFSAVDPSKNTSTLAEDILSANSVLRTEVNRRRGISLKKRKSTVVGTKESVPDSTVSASNPWTWIAQMHHHQKTQPEDERRQKTTDRFSRSSCDANADGSFEVHVSFDPSPMDGPDGTDSVDVYQTESTVWSAV